MTSAPAATSAYAPMLTPGRMTAAAPIEAPRLRDLSGLPDLLRDLRDHGVKPTVMGDLRQIERGASPAPEAFRPAAVR